MENILKFLEDLFEFCRRAATDDLYFNRIEGEVADMKNNEREALIERINGMSEEQLRVVAEVIPVELCMERISSELAKAKQFEQTVKAAVSGI